MTLHLKDLSSDQRVAYDAIVDWEKHNIQSKPILVCGGYAGCLSGRTIVEYNRGARVNSRPITLQDMCLKFNGKEGSGRGSARRWADLTLPTYLFSLWPDGTAARNRVVAVFESGVKPVIRLEFSDGTHLILTADHPIASPGGEFIAAGELSVGDTVLGRGSMKASVGAGKRPLDLRPPRIIVNTRHHPYGAVKDVESNDITYTYKRVARARLVVEAAMNDLPYNEFIHALKHNAELSSIFKYLPQEYDVHHLDEDTLNDDISNLQAMPHAEHARTHNHEDHLHLDYVREITIVRIASAGEEMTYDVQMESPANNFVANGIFVHNTGKSALLGVFARESGVEPIAFCAYTGKAASVLRRKLLSSGVATRHRVIKSSRDEGPDSYYETNAAFHGTPFCGTIHSLIYKPVVDEKTGRITSWELREELDAPYKLIVCDEASMVSDEMLSDLRGYGIQILLVGDHGQLPPVSGMGSLMQHPDVRLEKIHRQAENNPIIRLSAEVRRTGRLDRKLADGKHITFAPITHLRNLLGKRYRGLAGDELFKLTTLVYTNRRRAGVNQLARLTLGRRGAPQVGEMVVCLRNQRDIGVYNGMRGIVTREQGRHKSWPWQIQAEVDFAEDGVKTNVSMIAQQFGRERTFDDFEEIDDALLATAGKRFYISSWKEVGGLYDYSYAATVHKFQGSQVDDVLLIAERPGPVDADTWKRWLYTSVTRAAERITILEG